MTVKINCNICINVSFYDRGTNKDLLRQRIENLRYNPFQRTHLADALQLTRERIFNGGPGNRQNVQETIILMTDAIPTEGKISVTNSSTHLHKYNI